MQLQILGTRGSARVRRRVLIRLSSGFVSGAELFLLLTHHFAATISPLRSLLPRFPRAVPDVVPAFFGPRAYRLARLATRTRCIQNSRQRAQSQSRQEPYETISVTIRHG